MTGIEAVALLDTGSTTSGITTRIAKYLGLAPRGKRPIGSIQGEGQAERFLFRVALQFPDSEPTFPFVFEDVEGFELREGFQLDVLIGMDVLRQCDFAMSRTGLCSLTFG